MTKKGKTERPAVAKPKSPTEVDSTGEPDETFIDDLRHILLKSYCGKNPALDDRQRLLDILELNTKYLKRSGADATMKAMISLRSLASRCRTLMPA